MLFLFNSPQAVLCINDNLSNAAQTLLYKTISEYGSQEVPLADLAEFIDGDRGKNYPTFDEFRKEGHCLFLNASNVTANGFNFDTCQFISQEKDEAMNKGHLSRGDIVLTSRGTIGNVAYYNNYIKYPNVRINSGMLIIRPKEERYKPVFLYTLLKSSYMKSAIEELQSGSAQPQLPIKDLQKAKFKVPVDGTILEKLCNTLTDISNHRACNSNEIDSLKESQALLLSKLSSC